MKKANKKLSFFDNKFGNFGHSFYFPNYSNFFCITYLQLNQAN